MEGGDTDIVLTLMVEGEEEPSLWRAETLIVYSSPGLRPRRVMLPPEVIQSFLQFNTLVSCRTLNGLGHPAVEPVVAAIGHVEDSELLVLQLPLELHRAVGDRHRLQLPLA